MAGVLATDELARVLNDYADRIIPALLNNGYHLLLAKGGPEHPCQPEQSLFTHIANDIFNLVQLAEFLVANIISKLNL